MKLDFLLLGKGILMGAADIVPGVSGGTIAFITGIYDRLLGAINGFLPALFALLKHRSWQRFIKESDLLFILTLFSGIIISIALASKAILFLLSNHPIPLWSFFFGLIIASSFLVGQELNYKVGSVWLFIVIGVIVAIAIVTGVPGEMTASPVNALFAGSIAICAMILPGISGSFILVLMGAYSFILGAISALNFPILLGFMAGCVIGLLAFSRILVFALDRFRSIVIALLLGFMVGSLYKVWPWKETLTFRENRHGELVPLSERNVSPMDYQSITGTDSQLALAITCALLAILLVWVAHWMSTKAIFAEKTIP